MISYNFLCLNSVPLYVKIVDTLSTTTIFNRTTIVFHIKHLYHYNYFTAGTLSKRKLLRLIISSQNYLTLISFSFLFILTFLYWTSLFQHAKIVVSFYLNVIILNTKIIDTSTIVGNLFEKKHGKSLRTKVLPFLLLLFVAIRENVVQDKKKARQEAHYVPLYNECDIPPKKFLGTRKNSWGWPLLTKWKQRS